MAHKANLIAITETQSQHSAISPINRDSWTPIYVAPGCRFSHGLLSHIAPLPSAFRNKGAGIKGPDTFGPYSYRVAHLINVSGPFVG